MDEFRDCDCYQCQTERKNDKVDYNTQHLFCLFCEGKGKSKIYDQILLRFKPCPNCHGTGK